jgi:hypothetical protein
MNAIMVKNKDKNSMRIWEGVSDRKVANDMMMKSGRVVSMR